MSDEELVERDWRLFTLTLQVMPASGYPIEFEMDGCVKTKNLGGVTRWSLRPNSVLRLFNQDGSLGYEFKFDPSTTMFYMRYENEALKGNLVLIGPPGSDFIAYSPPE